MGRERRIYHTHASARGSTMNTDRSINPSLVPLDLASRVTYMTVVSCINPTGRKGIICKYLKRGKVFFRFTICVSS